MTIFIILFSGASLYFWIHGIFGLDGMDLLRACFFVAVADALNRYAMEKQSND